MVSTCNMYQPLPSSLIPGFSDNLNFIVSKFMNASNVDSRGHVKNEADFQEIADEFNSDEIELYFAGSTFERLSLPDTRFLSGQIKPHLQYHKHQKFSDVDIVFLNKSKKTCLKKEPNQDGFFAEIDSADTYPGYCRLKLLSASSDEKCKFYSSDEFKQKAVQKGYIDRIYDIIKGPHRINLNEPRAEIQNIADQGVIHGPALTVTITDAQSELGQEVDVVVGVPCPDWPTEACHWITRTRLYDWPSTATVNTIVRDGCYLVPVGHPRSPSKHMEWRISFTKAEKVLAHSLLDTQRYCYLLMKIIYYYNLKHFGVISSYHMKTTLFWTCEQTPASIWRMDHIGECLLLVIDNFFQFLATGNLPNYFIPENNMLDGIPVEHLQSVTNAVACIRKEPWKCLLSVQEVYNQQLKQSYDLCQSVMDGMGLMKFTTRSFYNSSPPLLDQIFLPILHNMKYGRDGLLDRLLASLQLANVMVTIKSTNHAFQQPEDTTYQCFLDIIKFMQMEGCLPKSWTKEHSLVFMLKLLTVQVHSVPFYNMKYVLGNVSYFLQHTENKAFTCESHPSTIGDCSYLANLRLSTVLQEGDTLPLDICKERVTRLKTLELKSEKDSLIRDIYVAIFSLKQNELDSSREYWEKMRLGGEDGSYQVQLMTPETLQSCYLNQHGLTYRKEEIINGLISLGRFVDEEVSHSRLTLSVVICSNTCDSSLLRVCEEQGGKITIPLMRLCQYGLSISNAASPMVDMTYLSDHGALQMHWDLLCAEVMYRKGDFISALKSFRPLREKSPMALVASMLCSRNAEDRAQVDSEGTEDDQLIFSGNIGQSPAPVIIDHEATPSDGEVNQYFNEAVFFDFLDCLSSPELMEVATYWMESENLSSLELRVGICIGRILHGKAEQATGETRECLVGKARDILQQAVQKSGGNPLYTAHYLNYFRMQHKDLELYLSLQILNSIEDLSGFVDQTLVFHRAERHALPLFLQHALLSVKCVSIQLDAFLKYLDAVSLKPHSELESVPIDDTDFKTSHPFWVHKLHMSILHEINGIIFSETGRTETAQKSFIEAVKQFPGSHDRLYTNIRKCEEATVKEAMADMLKEDFRKAYSRYSDVWNTCLPRCRDACSKVLHLSEELLDLSAEEDRALRLSTLFLQHAVLQEQDLHLPDSHKAHVLCTLAYFYYRMYSSSELETEQNFESVVDCLKYAIKLTECGPAYTMLGSVLFQEKNYSVARSFLEKAIAKGKEALPLHDFQAKQAVHHLVTETRKFHLLNFLPVEPLFCLVTCSYMDHYDSFLVYALYLRTRCLITEGEDATQSIDEFELICEDEIGECSSKWALLGLLHLLTGTFHQASEHFAREIDGKKDIFEKGGLFLQLKLLAQCAKMLSPISQGRARQITAGWLHKLANVQCTEEHVTRYKYQAMQPSEPLSLAVFLSSELSVGLCSSQMEPEWMDVMVEIYHLLYDGLKEQDEMVEGLLTQVAFLMLEQYTQCGDSPSERKSSVAKQVDKAFQAALSAKEVHLTITRVGYAQFLLKESRFSECICQAKECQALALEKIGTLLKKLEEPSTNVETNELRQLHFYMDKCLVPASDLLVISHTLQHEFQQVFEVVDVILACFVRVQDLEMDPLAYLIKFTLDLTVFGATMDTVIAFHEAIIEQYTDSPFIATIHGNLGCMLFSHAIDSRGVGDEAEYGRLIGRARERFEKATASPAATMATYADFASFLYNIGEWERALVVICGSDDLHDDATGCNTYGKAERLCVDECLREIIDRQGKVKTSSHVYCQYLRVTTCIDLKRDKSLVDSEMEVLKQLVAIESEEAGTYETMIHYLRDKLDKGC